MFIATALSIMLISSLYIVLYTNHLTTRHKKEMDRIVIQQKRRELSQNGKVVEVNNHALGKAV